ncbi:MAG: hypothetical protein R3Y63_01455 [Eubacteriales bacterium]
MNMEITPSKIALVLAAILFSGGYYLGVTDPDAATLSGVLLVGSLVAIIASLVFFVKAEDAKQQRRLKSFMRAVDSMPKEEGEPAVRLSEKLPSVEVLSDTKISKEALTTTPVEKPKKIVPLSELPSFNQEDDLGVYQETKKK